MAVYFNDNLTEKQESPEMEEFCIHIKSKEYKDGLVITYKNKTSSTITRLDEVGTDYFCTFGKRGKNNTNLACDWLKITKKSLVGMRPNQWMQHNPELFVEAYYRIH